MATPKFHRKSDQRAALIRSLTESLILHGSIETTLTRAKVIARRADKLVALAKKSQDNLHKRRQVIAALSTVDNAYRLVDELAPQLTNRNSGFFKVERAGLRRGDGTQLARVSFVDKLESKPKPTPKTQVKPKSKTASKAKTSTARKAAK